MDSIKPKTLKLDYFGYMKAFLNLMKPRVMSLVIFTCAVGLLIAPVKVSFLRCSFFAYSCRFGVRRCWCIKYVVWGWSGLTLMTRTCLRPIPTGKLTKNQALAFGILSSLVSVIALYIFSNLIAATTIGNYNIILCFRLYNLA